MTANLSCIVRFLPPVNGEESPPPNHDASAGGYTVPIIRPSPTWMLCKEYPVFFPVIIAQNHHIPLYKSNAIPLRQKHGMDSMRSQFDTFPELKRISKKHHAMDFRIDTFFSWCHYGSPYSAYRHNQIFPHSPTMNFGRINSTMPAKGTQVILSWTGYSEIT